MNENIIETCRSCLMETSELRSIFNAGKICGKITKLSDMLNNCTNLEVIKMLIKNKKNKFEF